MMNLRYEDLKPLRERTTSEYVPEDEQIEEYAKYIGVIFPEEQYMWELAKEGVTASLPPGWEACQAPDGELLYRNIISKAIQEQHPLDEFYREKVLELRQAHKKYEQEHEEDQQNSVLQTITQQKSSQKSLHEDSQLDEIMMPSKQFFQPSATLKQEGNLLNYGMMDMNQNSHSNQTPSSRQNSKFLANFSSYEQKNKLELQLPEKITEFKSYQIDFRKEKLQMELKHLKNQQKLAEQLLLQLRRDNERRQKHLKQKLNRKKSKPPTKSH